MSGKGQHLAGALAVRLIYSYLNDVHAASYPQPPEEVGGEPYSFFKARYEAILEAQDKGAAKDQIADMALGAIREYLNAEGLDAKFSRAASLSAETAYLHFSSRAEILQRLEAGEPPHAILDELKNQPDSPIQTPDAPSLLGPE